MKIVNNQHISCSRRQFFKRALTLTSGLVIASSLLSKLQALPKPGSPLSGTTTAKVAIEHAPLYDREYLRKKIGLMFDKIGGLRDVLKPGDRATIKINLTGGISSMNTWEKNYPQFTPFNTYLTHPEITRVVGELLKDAGASEIRIVEASYDGLASFRKGGFEEVAAWLGAKIVDLNDYAPYPDWTVMNVPNPYRFNSFMLNPILEETDLYVSLPKLKYHIGGVVTLSMKNQIGITSTKHMEYSGGATNRASLHNDLMASISDLNLVSPVKLTVIDGIQTIDKGEGPWNGGQPWRRNLLIAGKDPLAADTVGAALLGVDPENVTYLKMVGKERGMGETDLNKIDCIGLSIENALKLSSYNNIK